MRQRSTWFILPLLPTSRNIKHRPWVPPGGCWQYLLSYLNNKRLKKICTRIGIAEILIQFCALKVQHTELNKSIQQMMIIYQECDARDCFRDSQFSARHQRLKKGSSRVKNKIPVAFSHFPHRLVLRRLACDHGHQSSLITRAANEHLRSLKFYNHLEGPLKRPLLRLLSFKTLC